MHFVRFEYDAKHQTGVGQDSGNLGGQYALVALEKVLKMGQEAFVDTTGLPTKHIIAYSTTDLYDRNGNLIEEQ